MENISQLVDELLKNASFTVHTCGISTPPHSEKYTVISPFGRIMLGCKGLLTIKQMNKTYYLKSSTAVLVPPNTKVTFIHSPNTKFYWLYYNIYYNNTVDISEIIAPARLNLRANNKMSNTFKNLIIAFKQSTLESRFRIIASLACLIEPFMQTKNILDYPVKSKEIARLLPVIQYINTHINKPLTLCQLANIVHLSPVYFSELFSKTLNISPIQYLIKRRITRAKEYLLFTNESISQIAQQIGFKDSFYFSRLFKRKIGMSPLQYRQLYQHDVKRKINYYSFNINNT